ncbi:MAG: hypothetical protein ACRCYU_11030 [Nocardioides sp.]
MSDVVAPEDCDSDDAAAVSFTVVDASQLIRRLSDCRPIEKPSGNPVFDCTINGVRGEMVLDLRFAEGAFLLE